MSISIYYPSVPNTIIYGIALDGNNNLYIPYFTNNNIVKVDTGKNPTIFSTGYNHPNNIVFDNTGFPYGYMYVFDASKIYKVDVNGSKTSFFDFSGNPTPNTGVAIDGSNNLYYIGLTTTTISIYKVDTSGTLSLFIDGSGVFTNPRSIAFDTQKNMYIGDSNYVKKFDSNGNLLNATYILNGTNNPCNLIFTSTNVYFIKATLNVLPPPPKFTSTFSKYDLSGNFLETIYTFTPSSFPFFGLAFDTAGNIYIANSDIYEYSIGSGPPPTPAPIPCFKENTNILTNKGYFPIQKIQIGDYVKTSKHGYVPVTMIGQKNIKNPATSERLLDRLYICSPNQYPELTEELVITGRHAILVDSLTEEEEKETEKVLNKIYITEEKYRLPVCVDKRSETYPKEGEFKVFHIALQNRDANANYGIYANGLLVESCSSNVLKYKSNMELLEKPKMSQMKFV